MAIIAVATVVAVAVIAVGAQLILGSGADSSVATLPSSSPSASAFADPSAAPSGSAPAAPSASAPSKASSPPASTVPNLLPVKWDANADLETQIQMAAGSNGSLYVAVPGRGGVVVSQLAKTGKPTAGWPILIKGVNGCNLLLPVADGSVRTVCNVPTGDELGPAIARVFALGANGRSLHGFPVDMNEVLTGRMIGNVLRLIVRDYGGDVEYEGMPLGARVAIVEADGTVRNGSRIASFVCCDNHSFAIGPDGISYGTTHRDWATDVQTDITAFGTNGPRRGWPVTIDGNGSELAFDAKGRVYVAVGSPTEVPARVAVFDQDGRLQNSGTSIQLIISSNPRSDADTPGPAIVAADGTMFLVSTDLETTAVLALEPTNGNPIAGWPYRTKLELEYTGGCRAGDTGCGKLSTRPAVGSGNRLYLFHASATSSSGGTIVAIGPNGRVLDGWPVGLKRAGSKFVSMAVGPNGGVWALAIEKETNGSSATILSIAADSTVLWTTTIVQP